MDEELLFRSLQGSTTGSEEAAAQAWRQASAENELRYQELARLLTMAVNADSLRSVGTPPPVEDIIEASEDPSHVNARSLSHVPVTVAWPKRYWVSHAAALAAMVVLGFAFWKFQFIEVPTADLAVQEVATGPSVAVTITLVDGSVVRLGPKSRLRAESRDAREMFVDGRAYFAVAKQKGGPLRIRTSAGEVKVVGTRFEIETNATQLRLVVVEGHVVLSAHGTETDVSAGEMARVVEGMRLPVVIQVPSTEVPVEQFGNFLAFQDTPLKDAAREIEHQFGVHVLIADSALGSRTITGWFADWTSEEIMDVICVATYAECSKSGSIVTMQPRAGPGR